MALLNCAGDHDHPGRRSLTLARARRWDDMKAPTGPARPDQAGDPPERSRPARRAWAVRIAGLMLGVGLLSGCGGGRAPARPFAPTLRRVGGAEQIDSARGEVLKMRTAGDGAGGALAAVELRSGSGAFSCGELDRYTTRLLRPARRTGSVRYRTTIPGFLEAGPIPLPGGRAALLVGVTNPKTADCDDASIRLSLVSVDARASVVTRRTLDDGTGIWNAALADDERGRPRAAWITVDSRRGRFALRLAAPQPGGLRARCRHVTASTRRVRGSTPSHSRASPAAGCWRGDRGPRSRPGAHAHRSLRAGGGRLGQPLATRREITSTPRASGARRSAPLDRTTPPGRRHPRGPAPARSSSRRGGERSSRRVRGHDLRRGHAAQPACAPLSSRSPARQQRDLPCVRRRR